MNTDDHIYDLCGVINHLGHSISSGHYTAFARTHLAHDSIQDELGWRYFDDSRVVEVKNPHKVVTNDAYVLMYRLRKTGPTNPITTTTTTTSLPPTIPTAKKEEMNDEQADNKPTLIEKNEDVHMADEVVDVVGEDMDEELNNKADNKEKDEFFDVESDNFSLNSPTTSDGLVIVTKESAAITMNSNIQDRSVDRSSSNNSSSSEEFTSYTNLDEVD